MEMTRADYYRALMAHDPRFDGLFFICVKTTGIYCRPICPTHVPKLENCTFVATAAEAEKAGYRPCLRCRPELAPAVREANDSPAHLLCQQIEDTLLMDETLEGVAAAYGLSERHLRRLFVESYGVDPKQYLTTRRLLFAKQLLQDTNLSISDVAYSAGFNTPGRLTINMRAAYGFTPERFRRGLARPATNYLTLRADYRPPFDWTGLLALLADRATPLESIDDNMYRRTIDGYVITVINVPERHHLRVQVPIELSRQSHAIVGHVRQLFDLDANPCAIEAALSEDPLLAVLFQKYPGLRVPGAWDGFELLLRVIIGQQISVAGATTLMRRLVERIGVTPEAIRAATPGDIAAIGLPAKRAATIHEVGRRVIAGELSLSEGHPGRFYDQLVAIPGIGPWTAEYLRLRVLHWPDALPAGDLGIQKALTIDGRRPTERQVTQQALRWRPWRSYATMLLWRSLSNQGG